MRNYRLIISFVAACLIVSACQSEVSQEVLVIGDSITVGASDDIVHVFNGVEKPYLRYLPAISASGGQGLTYVGDRVADPNAFWSAHVASLMERGKPDSVVVSLGVNDCSRLTPAYGARIDNFMAGIPSSVPVYWLTIPDPRKVMACEGTINAALAAAKTRWPNLTLLPWASTGNAHPAWFDREGIHHTPEGQVQYAKFIKARLDEAIQ